MATMEKMSTEQRTLLETTLLEDLPTDGSGPLAAKQKRMRMMYCVFGVVYLVGGSAFFYFVEGWYPRNLGLPDGLGDQHAHVCGKVPCGGRLRVSQALPTAMALSRRTYQEKVQNQKFRSFLVGCTNIILMCLISVLTMRFYFNEGWVSAIYLSSISVLKLDSICLLSGVICNHTQGSVQWLIFTTVHCVVTFSVVTHFIVSASHYLGSDPDTAVSRLHHISTDRFARMDVNIDGKISRSEFLRDRLIQDGICDIEALDAILRNFDRLDKDKSGHINICDM